VDRGSSLPAVGLLEELEIQDLKKPQVSVEDGVAVEEGLTLDGREGKRLAEGIHEDVVGKLGLHDEDRGPVGGSSHRVHDPPACILKGGRVPGIVREGLDRRDPVGLAPVLLHDPEAADPLQDDVETAVLEGFALLEQSRTARTVDGRTPVVGRFPAGAEQGHADRLVVAEDVHDHLAISWLEDVKGQGHLREENGVRQGKKRQDGWDGVQLTPPALSDR
jgi:hypothetical protein